MRLHCRNRARQQTLHRPYREHQGDNLPEHAQCLKKQTIHHLNHSWAHSKRDPRTSSHIRLGGRNKDFIQRQGTKGLCARQNLPRSPRDSVVWGWNRSFGRSDKHSLYSRICHKKRSGRVPFIRDCEFFWIALLGRLDQSFARFHHQRSIRSCRRPLHHY